MSFVEGDIIRRMKRALNYIDKALQSGGDFSQTRFGITAELIAEGNILSLFYGKEPSVEELSEILSEGTDKLINAADRGLFNRRDIQEIFFHLYKLAYLLMLPESESPDSHEGVKLVLDSMDTLRRSID